MTDSPSPVPSSLERAEHTPGPWEVYDDRIGELQVGVFGDRDVDGPHGIVAESYFDLVATIQDNPRDSANARLIAAAPALYEALKGLVDDDDAGVSLADQRSRHEARMAAAKAAILKANGSEQ